MLGKTAAMMTIARLGSHSLHPLMTVEPGWSDCMKGRRMNPSVLAGETIPLSNNPVPKVIPETSPNTVSARLESYVESPVLNCLRIRGSATA